MRNGDVSVTAGVLRVLGIAGSRSEVNSAARLHIMLTENAVLP